MIRLRGRVSIAGGCHRMGVLPARRCVLPHVRHTRGVTLAARGVQPVGTDELHAGRWDVLGKLGEKVEGVEEVQILREVLRVCRVEQHTAFAGLIADLRPALARRSPGGRCIGRGCSGSGGP